MPNLRVLLVEDDDDNRELMAEVLETSGCDVVSASNGHEGLEKLAAGGIDVVVTDVGMPGMGGLDLAKAVRAKAPHVAIVVVTGWAERDDIAAARGKHVDAVLIKPVDPDALTQTVTDVARTAPSP
jgi:two-component system OmpR family response regulator